LPLLFGLTGAGLRTTKPHLRPQLAELDYRHNQFSVVQIWAGISTTRSIMASLHDGHSHPTPTPVPRLGLPRFQRTLFSLYQAESMLLHSPGMEAYFSPIYTRPDRRYALGAGGMLIGLVADIIVTGFLSSIKAL